MIIPIFLILSCLLSSSSHAIVEDFCVGDVNRPMGPSGYACKDPNNVTVDDFVYTGFRGPKNTSENIFKNSVILAFANAFPALNGLDISMGRLDLGIGGAIPMHTHRTSEIIIVVKGTIIAGFIDNNDVAYYKKLQVGDVMVFPQSLLHFQVNAGNTPALAFVSLNTANPGLQVVGTSLFSGNLPPELAEKTMLFDRDQVKKLRKIYAATD